MVATGIAENIIQALLKLAQSFTLAEVLLVVSLTSILGTGARLTLLGEPTATWQQDWDPRQPVVIARVPQPEAIQLQALAVTEEPPAAITREGPLPTQGASSCSGMDTRWIPFPTGPKGTVRGKLAVPRERLCPSLSRSALSCRRKGQIRPRQSKSFGPPCAQSCGAAPDSRSFWGPAPLFGRLRPLSRNGLGARAGRPASRCSGPWRARG